jgi:uncharacterized protein
VELERYKTDKVGLPTLTDIMDELARPGRDPREQFESFSFDENVQKIEDLKPEMELPGIVTNITNFGAFVDLGVHQDGLLHISEIADHFVEDPNDELKVRQHVTVTVLNVDLQRNRIALSMCADAAERAGREDTRKGRGKSSGKGGGPRNKRRGGGKKGGGGRSRRSGKADKQSGSGRGPRGGSGGFGTSLGDLLKGRGK